MLTSMTILIAEDDRTCSIALRRSLEMLGHSVVVATDGEEACRLLCDRDDIDMVISDWMMPGMDGLELCRRVRKMSDRLYLYFILLTARTVREDRLAGLQAGADDFLTKPIDRVELAARLGVARRLLAAQAELHDRTVQLERLRDDLACQNERLEEMATSDGLTGLKNHRHFLGTLDLAVSFAGRQGMPLSVVMLDVDRFKDYNDSFGHPAGDQVLKAVARILRENVRDHDLVARYGGEEFVAILPATDARTGRAVGERVRAAIEGADWPRRGITASVGVATLGPGVEESAILVETADRALYRAKALGRNRVVHAHDVGDHADNPPREAAIAAAPDPSGRDDWSRFLAD